MEASKPVFVLATAKTCPHCHKFRENWDVIKEAIESSGLARVVDIEVSSTTETPDTRRYPRDLARWVRWYPTFLLIRGKSWDASLPEGGREGPNSVLDGVIFNGQITPTKAEFVKGVSPTKDNILDWIRRESANLSEGSNQILSLLSAGTLPPRSVSAETYYMPTTAPTTGSVSVCRMKLRPRNP